MHDDEHVVSDLFRPCIDFHMNSLIGIGYENLIGIEYVLLIRLPEVSDLF